MKMKKMTLEVELMLEVWELKLRIDEWLEQTTE